jgi:molybdate transport system substrate-binding protein
METFMKLRTVVTTMAWLTLAQIGSVNAQAPVAPANPPPGGPPMLGQKVAEAKPDEIRVIATGAIIASLEPVKAQADKAVGKHLVIEYGAARAGLRDQILNGQAFEVAILVPDVNDELIKNGFAQTRKFEVARVPVAVGYAGNVSAPDISTPAALKKTLLNAKEVSYAPQGLGAQTANKLLSELGISDSIKRSSAAGGGAGGGQLGNGEYSISIFPASEIISNKNVKYIGPVIDQYQVAQVLEAVVGTHAKDEKAAKAFIDFLRSPAFEAALTKNGMVQSK